MAKCKWCGFDAEVNKHGYCANCNDKIRSDIKSNIAVLVDLADRATPFLPGDEKNQIHKTMLESYETLKNYKSKKVPFFKSDINILRANVLKQLGMEVPPVVPTDEEIAQRKKHGFIATISMLVIVASIVIICISGAFSMSSQKDLNPLTSAKVKTAVVMNGSNTKHIGTRAYIRISKDILKTVTLEQYSEFVDTVVINKGYNWFSIVCDDGTGIAFTGAMGTIADYGGQDEEGRIVKPVGTILQINSGYTYIPRE